MKLQAIKGIGASLEKKLNNLGIYTPIDLVNFLPSQYINLEKPQSVDKLQDGAFVLVKAKILNIKKSENPRKDFFKLELEDLSSERFTRLYALYFNQGYYLNKFKIGDVYRFLGKIRYNYFKVELTNPLVENEENIKNLHDGIFTVYPLKGEIGQNVFKNILKSTIAKFEEVDESEYTCFDSDTSKSLGLPPILDAIKDAHFPENYEKCALGTKRLAIEDTANTIGIYRIINSKTAQNRREVFYKIDKSIILDYKNAISFAPTQSQEKAFEDIYQDLTSFKNMKRIINGDVGSGKTLVSFFALYCAAKSNHQGAMMAPTEILAKQHAINFDPIAKKLGINYALLTSSTKASEAKYIKNMLQLGEIDVIFGTQSILNEEIIFNDLSLVIIDEQHKFGVSDRKRLEDKCKNADVISMSATPIPRTLFLTMYKGIDISHIDNRNSSSNITTRIVYDNKCEDMLKYVSKECLLGKQAFIVCPSIKDSEGLEIYSAETLYKETEDSIFANNRVGILHGKMKADDKNKVMEDFINHNLDILISTTVIEVGIDTDASLLVVMDSERFGLASLHQLRGRIGRRNQASFCFLHTKLNPSTVSERLIAMEETTDGLALAEKDFEMRGSGDYIGLSQSGFRKTGKYPYAISIQIIKKASQLLDLAIQKNPQKTDILLENKQVEYADFLDVMFNTTLNS